MRNEWSKAPARDGQREADHRSAFGSGVLYTLLVIGSADKNRRRRTHRAPSDFRWTGALAEDLINPIWSPRGCDRPITIMISPKASKTDDTRRIIAGPTFERIQFSGGLSSLRAAARKNFCCAINGPSCVGK